MSTPTPAALLAGARRIAAAGRGGRPSVVERCVSGFMLAMMLTTASVRTSQFVAPGPALLTFTLLAWGALLFRTYRPVLALAGTVVFELCILVFLAVPTSLALQTSGMGAYQPVPLASMVAAYTVASRTPQRFGWTAGTVAGGLLFAASALTHPTSFLLADLVMFYLVLSGTGVGVIVTARRDRAERLVRDAAESTARAVLDERLHIARELHDVLAHNLTLINAQAGVAEYLLSTRPEDAAVALRDITQHTARAIDELRATLGLLRSDGSPSTGTSTGTSTGAATGMSTDGVEGPTPGIDQLAELAGAFRSAGTTVEVAVTGERGELDQHADLAAYRIVQEALTNAAKHAPGTAVGVTLDWSADALAIRVSNAAPPRASRAAAPGTGHGLIGMRERAEAAGGAFDAGAVRDGGFLVSATLPVRATAPLGADQ